MNLAQLKKTLVTGFFVLIPVVVVFVLLGQVFKLTITVAEQFEDEIPLEGPLEVIAVNLIAAVLVLVVLFALGKLAEAEMLGSRVEKLDRLLNRVLPGYTMIKGVIAGAVDHQDDTISGIQSVMVEWNGGVRVGFEVDRTPSGQVVVFLPNAPNVQTGISLALEADRVERLDISPHQVWDMMEFYGRGLAEIAESKRRGKSIAEEEERPPSDA